MDGILRGEENVFTFGRFAATQHVETDWIYTQDDDVIQVEIERLYEEAMKSPDRITAGLPSDRSSRHWDWYRTQDVLHTDIGYGSFYKKDRIDQAFQEWDQWYPRERNLGCRKADKVFTVLHGQRKLVHIRLKRLQHKGRESGMDQNSLWLRRDHKALDRNVTRKLQRMIEPGHVTTEWVER